MVFNIQRFSLHDGPGIRTNIFFKGCPLDCRWCANPESKRGKKDICYDKTKCISCGACAKACPSGALSLGETGVSLDRGLCTGCLSCVQVCPGHALYEDGTEYTVEELMREVLKDKHYFDHSGGGVTLSGGEPLAQYEFLIDFLKELKKEEIHVVMETCGYSRHFREVIPYVDVLYFDVKHPDNEKHLEMTGRENSMILDNLKYAVRQGKNVVVRIPVVPGLNDDSASWDQYAGLLNKAGVREAHLLPFHQLGQEKYRNLGIKYAYEGVPPMEKSELEKMKKIFEKSGIKTQIGG